MQSKRCDFIFASVRSSLLHKGGTERRTDNRLHRHSQQNGKMPLSSDALAVEELATGISSAVGSFLIIVTYVLFPSLRKLRYVELIFYVSVNDFMAAIAMALGPSPNGSAACWYQGMSTTGNYLSSVFWTSIITYQAYAVVVREQGVLRDMRAIHKICWGFPLFLTFIPLSTSTYNNPDDEETWCFVADRKGSPPWSQLFWFIASFYVWVWMAMLWNLYMLTSIAWKLRQLKAVPVLIMSTIGKLAPYPVIICICWALNTVANVYTFSTGRTYTELSSSWTTVSNLGVVMATLQGFFNALVFFSANQLVREHWACLLGDLWEGCTRCGAKERPGQGAAGADAERIEDPAPPAPVASSKGSTTLLRRVTTQLGMLPGTGRTNSSLLSARGLRMALAVESQADYVGEGPVDASSADLQGGSAAPEEGQVPPSIDSVSTSPLSALVQGLSRTASGWWEAARLSSTVSLRSSFNFHMQPSNSSAGTGLRAQPTGPAGRMNSVASSSSAVSSSGASVHSEVELQARPVTNPMAAHHAPLT